MHTLARVTFVVLLLAVSGFCVFGFLATYEPPGSPTLLVVYGTLGLLCVAGAGRVLFHRRMAEQGERGRRTEPFG
jgi:hypothetical protein